MIVFSACCNSERVNSVNGFSSFDLATGFPGSLTSLAKSLDCSGSQRAIITFGALYQLDTPSSLLLSKFFVPHCCNNLLGGYSNY